MGKKVLLFGGLILFNSSSSQTVVFQDQGCKENWNAVTVLSPANVNLLVQKLPFFMNIQVKNCEYMKLCAVVGKTEYKLKTVVDVGLLLYVTNSMVQGFSSKVFSFSRRSYFGV
jgi:hypothetical protein